MIDIQLTRTEIDAALGLKNIIDSIWIAFFFNLSDFYLKEASKKSDVMKGGIGPAPIWKKTTKIRINVTATIDIVRFVSSPIDTRTEPVTKQHTSIPPFWRFLKFQTNLSR